MLFLTALLAVVGPSGLAAAQSIPVRTDRIETAHAAGVRHIHVTNRLEADEAASKALEAYRRRSLSVVPPANAGVTPNSISSEKRTDLTHVVGDSATFEVLESLITQPYWTTETFVVVRTSPVATIWVSTGAVISTSTLDHLAHGLVVSTPSGSIDPTQGIIKNNNDVFGPPSDVDGNGRVDVLLYDISEGASGLGTVLGYVTPENLSGRNQREILYLDTNPGAVNPDALLATAAHEYQHLIQYRYDGYEERFVNEGLSEWAERLNGFPVRSITYLASHEERNASLFQWRSGQHEVIYDYQRAGLFTAYFAQRLGALATGNLARDPLRGADTYENALLNDGLSLGELLLDFHTATLVNDRLIDPRFGFADVDLKDLHVTLGSEHIVDGRAAVETPSTEALVNSGGAHFSAWTHTENLALELAPVWEPVPGDALARIVRYREGHTSVDDAAFGSTFYDGQQDRVELILVHASPVSRSDVDLGASLSDDHVFVSYAASWFGNGGIAARLVRYGDGGPEFFIRGRGAGAAFATHFVSPGGGARLAEVHLPVYYADEFEAPAKADRSAQALTGDAPAWKARKGEARAGGAGSPAVSLTVASEGRAARTRHPDGEMRDFELVLWEVGQDGAPADVIYSRTVVDERSLSPVSTDFMRYLTLDVSETDLDLPAEFLIGVRNTGEDANDVILPASAYSDANVSYLQRDGDAWTPLWDWMSTGGEYVGAGFVLPIRALFHVPSDQVSTAPEPTLPTVTSLAQNFPNPFRGATTIPFELARSTHIALEIFDVTGRSLGIVSEGLRPAGQHYVDVNAATWSSGPYLYRLTAAGQTHSGMMVRLSD